MRTRVLAISLISALVAVAAPVAGCARQEGPSTKTPAPDPSVRFFGNPPALDQSDRIGTNDAPQSFTPAVKRKGLNNALRIRWRANVGRTTYRTTMVHADGKIILGTQGKSFGRVNEPGDAVHVLDAKTGAILRKIAPPGGGDRDVNGVAVDSGRVFFSTDSGLVVAAELSGKILWKQKLRGEVLAAPALGDTNGDGKLEVIVGDQAGRVVALSSDEGKVLWERDCGRDPSRTNGVVAGVALYDVDGNGKLDVIAGGGAGAVYALRGHDGAVLWQSRYDAALRAPPSIVDVDGDGTPEILVAWSNAEIRLLDARSGHTEWRAHMEQDNGDSSGLLGAPLPLPGPKAGALIVPTARWGRPDGLVVLGHSLRLFRSVEGRISASPVAMALDPKGPPDAIVGTEMGDVVALNALGERTWLAHVGGEIEASPLLADTDGDGTFELIIASNDGHLTCYATGVASKPLVLRFRGDSPHNDGQLGALDMGWNLKRAVTK